jgi:diguanylate cyclase (GGDEF)-like protein
MTNDSGCRKVLIAAEGAEQGRLGDLFARASMPGWESMTADCFERARFLLQHDPCDVLLVDESFSVRESPQALAWLVSRTEASVVLLSGAAVESVTAALENGVHQWLPRQLVLDHPPLLAAALRQACRWRDLRQGERRTADSLRECRRQVGRLVGMLWESTPVEANVPWFTQRYMMERLQEEIARTKRHGSPFSVVLGELRIRADSPFQFQGWTHLSALAAKPISRTKRRCDVIGQYGPDGFMLLLANTAEQGALQLCRRLEQQLAREPSLGPFVTSFGVASSSEGAPTSQGLLGRAEEELERARLGQRPDGPG